MKDLAAVIISSNGSPSILPEMSSSRQVLGPFPCFRLVVIKPAIMKYTVKYMHGGLILPRLITTFYDKHDEFNFAIVKFPFLCSNTPLSPAYGVYMYISQLIQYARACFAYENFSKGGQLRTKKVDVAGL
jgi:hypothetical protein